MIRITIHRTATGYQAHIEKGESDYPSHEGSTPSEALGALVTTHPTLFGIEIIDRHPKTPDRTSADEGGDEFVN